MTPNTSPIHTLSLHDALPISHEREGSVGQVRRGVGEVRRAREQLAGGIVDRDVPWIAANHDPAEGARVGDGAVAVRDAPGSIGRHGAGEHDRALALHRRGGGTARGQAEEIGRGWWRGMDARTGWA